MGHAVFICHATKDRAEATSICELLERNGISCWLAPRNIPPGATWSIEIGNAINNAEVMLVLISSTANLSREVLREVQMADRKQKKIVPIRIENVTISDKLEFHIGGVQWVDVFPDPIVKYWPQLSLSIGRMPGSIDKNAALTEDNKHYEETDSYDAERVTIKENKKEDRAEGRNAIFSNFPAKITAIGVALSALLGTLTLVVNNVKAFRDAVCDLTLFCDDSDQAALKSADYNADKLKLLATSTTQAVQKEANRRLADIEKEQEDIKSVGYDKTKLTQLVDDAKTPQVRAEARDRLSVIEKEEEDIKSAAWDRTKLTPMARAHSPDVRAEANRKLSIIATEQKNYEAARNDLASLTEFLAKPCEACLVRQDGQRQLEKLNATREQSNEESLKSADYDKTRLTPLASGAHSPEVRAEAGNSVNMLGEIRSRLYELNFDPDPDLSKAIRDFETTNKIVETGTPTAELLQRLRETPAYKPWGAIVYREGKDNISWGMSYRKGTREDAVKRAHANCDSPEVCPNEISFYGTMCGVVAHGAFTRFDSRRAIVASSSILQAKKKALSECRKHGPDCSIVAQVCADGTEFYELRKSRK